jgi:hypothetical protein
MMEPGQLIEQRRPYRRGYRDAVDEDDGHSIESTAV